ncbi:intraflagellar transport protein 25 homolog [Dysidea avara]|uniref:intraflagellar transport protein 25 homolog n=1 Tax=Dysidea avara TaxID=196820 RepID=UPI003333DBAB
MFDIANSSTGASITLATSHDDDNPPENIIDGKSHTFWSTTGLFPQEFVLSFSSLMSMNKIILTTTNVRKISIEKTVKTDPKDFEFVVEKEFEFSDGQLQKEEFKLTNTPAVHLRFTILEGYDHFVSVHQVNIDGTAVRQS